MNSSVDKIKYTLKRNTRSRTISIRVSHDGEVRVSAPYLMPVFLIDKFVSKKSQWIVDTKKNFVVHPVSDIALLSRRHSKKEYLANKDEALDVLTGRAIFFNKHYGFEIGSISIRNQRSRWGSCSKNKNINFSYKLLLLPPEVRDYVVVHELCHLKEMNHSKAFWNIVAETVPDYKIIRKRLRGVE